MTTTMDILFKKKIFCDAFSTVVNEKLETNIKCGCTNASRKPTITVIQKTNEFILFTAECKKCSKIAAYKLSINKDVLKMTTAYYKAKLEEKEYLDDDEKREIAEDCINRSFILTNVPIALKQRRISNFEKRVNAANSKSANDYMIQRELAAV